ncbi:MAG: threonine/homoserine/homoserine lactone efflux protein [Candidatus Omnitrophota bacterium]|jgi:threonine/homoserine/homoserine lactone efflux protein
MSQSHSRSDKRHLNQVIEKKATQKLNAILAGAMAIFGALICLVIGISQGFSIYIALITIVFVLGGIYLMYRGFKIITKEIKALKNES